MEIKAIITQYNDQLEECYEIGYITEQEKPNVREFLSLLPNLNCDSLFLDFLFTFFAATSGNIGLHGYDMMNEVNDHPISDQDYLVFSDYSKADDPNKLYIMFLWDLTGQRQKGVYCQYQVRFEHKVVEESTVYYFCKSFVELLDVIFNWEIKHIKLETIQQQIIQKYGDQRA